MTEKSDDEEQTRKRAADSLKRQIKKIVSGAAEPKAPKSLRDFIAGKMAEDEETAQKTGSSAASWRDEERPHKEDSPGQDSGDKK